MNQRTTLQNYALLSIGAALLTIGLKAGAYLLTGSVGLLSDALESIVNLVAALVAFGAIRYATQPPDADHSYGHDKAEYFSSGIEGLLILIAALSIMVASVPRLLNAQPLEQVGVGLAISVGASLVNLIVARVLLRAGKQHGSITLEADGHHLMTDVWTSVGVIVGVAGVALTGWNVLDPLIGLLVAANILWMGYKLLRRSVLGLLDTALPPEDLRQIDNALRPFHRQGIETHALRTRQSGARRFVSLHVLVPNDWTVSRAHGIAEQIEKAIRVALPRTTVFTHLEPQNEAVSYEDMALER
jgi:cation diffusion facilitator family transporter